MRNIFVALIVLAGTGAAIVGGPFYALLFYLWNAYFRPQEWVFSDWVFSLRLSYTLAAILPVTIVLWGQRLRFNRGLILPALFVVVAGLSAGMSDYSDRALDFFYDFGRIAFITFVIATITDDMKKLRLVFMTIAFSLGFEAVKQGFATMILSPGGANRNTIYFLGDNNGVGLGMLLLTTIFVALAQTSEGPLQRTLFRFGALGVCYRAISTYSRGAFIAGGALALFYMARSRHRLRTAVGIAVVCLTILPLMPNEFWERMETITAGQEERDSSASERLHLWGVGLKMAQANPIIGVGFNSFRYAVNVYDTEVSYEGEKAPHSSWIGVLSEMGVLGLILYSLVLCQVFAVARRSQRLPQDHPDARGAHAFGRALQGCVIVIAVGGTFLHIQYTEMLWHLVGLSIALDTILKMPSEVTVPQRGVPGTSPQGERPVWAPEGRVAYGTGFDRPR